MARAPTLHDGPWDTANSLSALPCASAASRAKVSLVGVDEDLFKKGG